MRRAGYAAPANTWWRKHLTRRLPDLVPWIFDYYTKLGFSPAHKIHKIHALRRVSASSALSSFFGYRGLGLVGQWKLKSSVMRMPIQPLTWLVAVIAGWVQRDQQAAIVYLLEKNRVLKARLRGRKLCSSLGGPWLRPNSRPDKSIKGALGAPGPERASRLRQGSPGLDSGPLGRPLSRRSRPCQRATPHFGANVALENRD